MKECKCPECGKCFRERCAFQKHLNSHTVGMPYQCTTCEKSFSKKSSLVIHQQIHAERKLFTCHQCGRSFARKSNLLVHKKIHLQEKDAHRESTSHVLKPLKCDKKLKERPHKCPECKKTFVLHKNLIKHQKSHARLMPLGLETAHCVREQLSKTEKQVMVQSSKVEKQAADRSEMILEELTRMRGNLDMIVLNQQCQLQVLQEIQKQLGFLLPGNDVINSNVYSLGLLLSQQALATGLPLPVLLNPCNLLPENARPLSSQVPS